MNNERIVTLCFIGILILTAAFSFFGEYEAVQKIIYVLLAGFLLVAIYNAIFTRKKPAVEIKLSEIELHELQTLLTFFFLHGKEVHEDFLTKGGGSVDQNKN